MDLPSSELDWIAELVGRGPYQGYPKHHNRLFVNTPGLHVIDGRWIVPDGPWHVSDHPNRWGKKPTILDAEILGTERRAPEESHDAWRRHGLALDQFDRPIHPNASQLLADPRIGLPTGLGFFYRYGPNATVDPAIYRRFGKQPTELLLIKRQEEGQWALPGGFLDPRDASPEAGARREAAEETHLTHIGGTGEVIFRRRPVGMRTTLHAWTENTVVLIHGNQEYLFDTTPEADDDAIDVGWFTLEQIQELDMFDAHDLYINHALERIRILPRNCDSSIAHHCSHRV